ncbi:hypothetical protein CAP47_04845 [Psychroflexus sp. S27]|uniref:hypothetical protein n=1 Tax=Psychroflexus sp. S27 TaxID=1982757 RepID=UPI000C2A0142|nr:hypothetical protein [Psychroflexus sp. S27]PJX24016.1 hypothetical protein CAP47_04845 [Psychroflexus sp. S27]
MQSKLTYQQTKRLYLFTKEHFVTYVELQRYFVKELAEKIDKVRQKNPKIGFEEALEVAFKSYGVYGFSDIEEKYINKIHFAYTKHFIKYYLKKFFEQKHLLLILIYILCATVFYQTGIQNFFTIFSSGGLLVFFIYHFVKLSRENKSKRLGKTTSLINETIQNSFQVIFPIIFLPQILLQYSRSTEIYSYILVHSFLLLLLSYFYTVTYNLKKHDLKKNLTKLTDYKLQ